MAEGKKKAVGFGLFFNKISFQPNGWFIAKYISSCHLNMQLN